jgi:hypothetical protein
MIKPLPDPSWKGGGRLETDMKSIRPMIHVMVFTLFLGAGATLCALGPGSALLSGFLVNSMVYRTAA